MKKIIALCVALVLVAALFTGCGKGDAGLDEKTLVKVRLGGLKGPTSMGMVKLLDDAENKLTENEYEFTMATAADELTPKLLKGDLDIVAVPANLGAVLYNNSNGAVCSAAVNTLGVLYIVEKGGEEIKSLSDLKGRMVYATGKGTTPEFALNHLLKQSGIDPEKDVSFEWKSEPTEIVAKMATVDKAVAMMPQPFVTVALNQLKDLRIALDMTKIWSDLDNKGELITAVMLVRKEFAEKNPQTVKKFLEEYNKSSEYVTGNPDKAAELVEKYGIVKAPIAKKAILYCNIVSITGDKMKSDLSGYFEVLYEQNPKSIGGKLPGDDFYITYE